ncbi:MAG: efflux RND transporter periplasmic adaptor subunit [Deltaproteobacteria bacterium]|nr:efflux RND transporter periplasmic adaptor subunit [Deltaproteobacteria bacterium]
MKRSLAKIAALLAVLATGAAVAVLGWPDESGSAPRTAAASAGEGTEPEAPTPVTTVPVRQGEIATYLSATANLVAEDSISVVAEVAGRVERVLLAEGEAVKSGALVVALDDREATLGLSTARIQVRQARATKQRVEALGQLVSEEEREKSRTDHDVAAQAVVDARFRVAQTRIRAPRSGKVTRRDVAVGQYVRAGDPVLEITDFSTLVARIFVPERDALALAPGRSVEFALQAAPGVKFEGTVRDVASVVDASSGTVKVTIEVTDAPPQVRSGSFVSVRMVREHHDQALWLPREAVTRGPRASHVFVVDGETVTRREVELGAQDGPRLHIVSGLTQGEVVVLAGHGKLADGAAVQVRSED